MRSLLLSVVVVLVVSLIVLFVSLLLLFVMLVFGVAVFVVVAVFDSRCR